MRLVPGAIARFAALAGLGLLPLAAPFSPEAGVAHAQGTSQVTLEVDAPTSTTDLVNGEDFTVGGWAGVPGGQDSGIVAVDVFLDGAPGTGAPLGSARLGIVRRDVATATSHPEWANSGFDFEWIPRNVTQGSHTLYVVARSRAGDSATQTVQVNSCGCGSSLQGSVTNPIVRKIGPGIWELDTGGPGVTIQRDFDPLFP